LEDDPNRFLTALAQNGAIRKMDTFPMRIKGFNLTHEPFRFELRNYDFGIFESQALSVSCI
tara:strand:+ start:373 stop:555 length:183 start_codon:yes stop_codon:yes gene_type:complete